MASLYEHLWLYGFKIFYACVHPRHKVLNIVRRIARVVTRKQIRPDGYLVPKPIPKKLWIFWAQGWEDASPLIKLCKDSWVAYNPGWEIVLLSEANLSDYVELEYSLEGKDITLTGYSNIVRLHLLKRYGGVWADATSFCSTPLDGWLPYVMQTGFFAFYKPKTTVASWFIAAEPDNALILSWGNYVRQYWKFTQKPAIYFWVQYLFEYMIWRDSAMRRLWLETPHINTDGPYAVQRRLKEEGHDADACVRMIFDGIAPVHKLSWKIDISEEFVNKLRTQLESVTPN